MLKTIGPFDSPSNNRISHCQIGYWSNSFVSFANQRTSLSISHWIALAKRNYTNPCCGCSTCAQCYAGQPLCAKHREPNSIKISFIHLKHNVIYSFNSSVFCSFAGKHRTTKTLNSINLTHAQRWNRTNILGSLAIVWILRLHKNCNHQRYSVRKFFVRFLLHQWTGGMRATWMDCLFACGNMKNTISFEYLFDYATATSIQIKLRTKATLLIRNAKMRMQINRNAPIPNRRHLNCRHFEPFNENLTFQFHFAFLVNFDALFKIQFNLFAFSRRIESKKKSLKKSKK